MELVLTKDAGLSLTDIRGERFEERTVEPPPRYEAWCGRVTRRVARLTAVGAVGAGLLLLALTNDVSPLLWGTTVAAVALAAGRVEPTERETVRTVTREGMTVDEVMGWLVQHDEHEQMKSDQAEAEARAARRTGQSGGGM
jgi:hypothetical protein